MKLSTKGRYGLRAMVDLAINSTEDQVVALSQIAERQEISVNYLEQLIARLRRAGLVQGIRGAQGGYILSKSPEDISIGDILRALEGNLNPVECTEIIGDNICNNSDVCVTKYVWKRISDSINQTVDSIKLSELLEESIRLIGNNTEDDNKPIIIC
ncbi:MAG TPA: RrF2 family transcriptional regulator [Clostridiales bacterium]|nr:RrF2 family transcriptional regulator [Clostridiales bacterium]